MQSVCTSTSASSTTCVYTGTSTIALDAPVVAYDPFVDVFLGISLWIIVMFALVTIIRRFR